MKNKSEPKPALWRVGRKVPINVYDEHGQPVCQCQSAEYARMIVDAVNRVMAMERA